MKKKFKADVLVISGAPDSVQIINDLKNVNLKLAITATTKFGDDFFEEDTNTRKLQRIMTSEGLVRIMLKHEVKCLVDASHCFADQVSIKAMKACKKANIKYLRYETPIQSIVHKDIIKVKNFAYAAKMADTVGGKIFAMVGSSDISYFAENIKDYTERLFVKVLPEKKVLENTEEWGIPSQNIIAYRGHFSEDMNKAIIEQFGINAIVTRDSGEAGGTNEKIQAALACGKKVILINRPKIDYLDTVNSISSLIYSIGNIMNEWNKR